MDERIREIPLTRGKVALVDAVDYEAVVGAGKWHVVPIGRSTDTFYAMRAFPDGLSWKKTGLHSFLTGYPLTDHINGDGLDNRRENLRPATHAQNMRNVGTRSNNRSGFKGVSWCARSQRWYACIKVDGRSRNLGYYPTPDAAALAYDAAALVHFGEFARPNFATPTIGE